MPEAADFRKEINEMRADLYLLKWMVGFVLAGVVTTLFKLLTVK